MSFSQFVKPYPNGYIDGEAGDTPVTAEILNTNYDGFLLGLNEFLPELAGMVEANPSESATAGNLTKLKVGNSIYLIPSGGSGGSTVEWEQLQLTGTKIATITIDNVPVDVYAPSGGGSGDEVEWTQTIGSGTKIGTITINGNPTDVYAPTPIDVEANPSESATAGDLTKLKVGSNIYSIPSGGSGGSGHTILDDDRTALAQEDDLQFKGVYSTDNSEDGVTEVNVYREMTKSEFNALSSDEKKGFIRVTDEPDIYSDGKFQPVIYSLEEREIGVWTDGKPLYQKTFGFSASYGGSWNYYNHQIANIDNVITCNAGLVTAGILYELPQYRDSGMSIVIGATATQIEYINSWIGTELNPYIVVTIQYTKITDTAGSGTWTPQGVPAVHYSTDEQIIGTWIDGSTLYEKTFYIHDRQFNSSGECAFDVTSLNSDILMADNMASYYTFSISSTEYVRQFEKLVPEEGHVYAYGPANRQIETGYITIRYTKSS